ncbi:hypothetical protein ABEY51_11505 [Priestia megaterium]
MKNNPKNFSVKIIKGNAYIYSWSYRKTSYRHHNTSYQRYYWKYRGRFGTRKVKDFMKRLNIGEQLQLKEEVQRKLKVHKKLQKQIDDLLKVEPFKGRYNEITSMRNRNNRESELKKLYSELTYLIKNKD